VRRISSVSALSTSITVLMSPRSDSTQLVTQWGTVFGDEVLAAAILDRLLHHSHTLMIQGDSYRLKQKRKAGLIPAVPPPQGALAGEPARADRRKHQLLMMKDAAATPASLIVVEHWFEELKGRVPPPQ